MNVFHMNEYGIGMDETLEVKCKTLRGHHWISSQLTFTTQSLHKSNLKDQKIDTSKLYKLDLIFSLSGNHSVYNLINATFKCHYKYTSHIRNNMFAQHQIA